jgi:cell division protein FtsA
MKKIYTSIELGSYSIKIVVSEVVGNNYNVLASSNTRCKGIKNGRLENIDEVKEYLLKGIKKIEDMLGFSIKETIIGIDSDEKSFEILSGSIKVTNEKRLITEEEIEKVYSEILVGNILDSEELLTIMPISFQVDNSEPTKDPKGMVGNTLSLKAVIIKVPRNNLRPYLELFKECGIKVVDITLGAIGDYYQAKNKEFDSSVSAIVNIGYDKIDVSIFNKGIMIKNSTCNEGSKLIDKELAYMYRTKTSVAKKIKETFAVGSTKYADKDDTMEVVTKAEDVIVINQYDVSSVVEARINYLLELAKNEISLLTNKEISNIIITGGITELLGFGYVCEKVFDNKVSILDIKTMGIRNNMYSSCFGLIKYFNSKLDFRGINYTMIKDEDLTKDNNKRDNIFNKFFGYFKDE